MFHTLRSDWRSILLVSIFSATVGIAGYAVAHNLRYHWFQTPSNTTSSHIHADR